MRAVIDYRATSHTASCDHPHADCYCATHWNDSDPKRACAECGEA